MKTDEQLLRLYLETRDESSFEELVNRHLRLVYTTALRVSNGDVALSKDVTQKVFTDLALKAHQLSSLRSVAGWLFTAARFAATKAVRSENTRKQIEEKAQLMKEPPGLSSMDDTTELGKILDDCLADLADPDRTAIILRFFEDHSTSQLAVTLNCQEDTARKRVDRALLKLRKLLAARGVQSSTASLLAILSAHSAAALPAGLAPTVVAATAAATTGLPLAKNLIPLMISTKIKIASTAALFTVAVSSLIHLQTDNQSLLQRSQLLESQRTTPVVDHDNAAWVEENQKLRAQMNELYRLRGEVTLLRRKNSELEHKEGSALETQAKPKRELAFIKKSDWNEVGWDSPENAFTSFLALLKSGDTNVLASVVHWEIGWKEEITAEDEAVVQKSTADYLSMLQKAQAKLNGIHLDQTIPIHESRKSLKFNLETTNGAIFESTIQMVRRNDNLWVPVVNLGWIPFEGRQVFSTGAFFGPEVELE